MYAERGSCHSGEVDADPADNIRENGIQNQGVLCVSFYFGVRTKQVHEQRYGELTTRMIKPHHIAGKRHCPSAQEYAVQVLQILAVLYCLPHARRPPTLCVLVILPHCPSLPCLPIRAPQSRSFGNRESVLGLGEAATVFFLQSFYF